ncbi:MAG: hypothetical protein ACLT33_07995 [Lachnospira pectinoschiza]
MLKVLRVIVQADELLDEYVFEGDELLFFQVSGHKSYYDCKDLLNFLKNTIRRITELQPYVQHLQFLKSWIEKEGNGIPSFEMC